ncbi:hypothetical protein ACFL09_02515, partial [Planctomycetota bacterium]
MHSLHVGYVGVMGNLHYLEMLDFVLGLPGWDIAGDDKATWLAKQEAADTAVASLPATSAAPAPAVPEEWPREKPSTVDVGRLDTRPLLPPPGAAGQDRKLSWG